MDKAEFRTVFAGVRPARIAVLFDEKDTYWQETCRRIIECLCSLWGGEHSVIIPTDGTRIETVFWDILKAFDADYICEYHKRGLDMKIASPQIYEERLQAEISRNYADQPPTNEGRLEIDRAMEGATWSELHTRPELQKQLKARLAPFFFEDTVVETNLWARTEPHYPLTALSTVMPYGAHPSRLIVTETKAPRVPPLWVESVLGGTYTGYADKIKACGVDIEASVFEEGDVFSLVDAQLDFDNRTERPFINNSPFRFTLTGLGKYRSLDEKSWKLPAVVVVGAAPQDFALYFNLSRMRPGVCWLLPDWIEANKAARSRATPGSVPAFEPWERYAALFAQALHNNVGIARSRNVEFLSFSLGQAHVEAIRDHLADIVRSGQIKAGRFVRGIGDALAQPRVAFNTDNFAVPTTQHVVEGKVAGLFPTPKPKGFTTITPYEFRWITELRVDGVAYPRHPVLGEWLLVHPTLGSQGARSGKQGLCYFCPNVAYFGGDVDTILVRPNLNVPNAERVFRRLAETAALTSRLSDKGFFTRDLVLKMGGLEYAAALLREPRYFAVLCEYRKDRSTEAVGKYLASDSRRYLRLADISAVIGNASEGGELIDRLLRCGVLQRGTLLKCQYCRTADWFSVRDLADDFGCKRCGRRQTILSPQSLKEPEPVWYYKLDEIAFQGLRNDMHVPLLTLDYLRRKNPRFSYVDEMELWKAGADHPFIEVDLCCICEGTLTIGEAKTTEKIEGGGKRERRSLAKYKEAALLLGAGRFVLATSKAWAAETLANAAATFADTDIEVMALIGDQILTVH